MRLSLSVLERDQAAHSEVMASLTEHVIAMAALVLSARMDTTEQARQTEEQLVRRAIGMTEALLRQALTPSAAAFDPDVVRRHSTRIIELAALIDHPKQGESHG